MDELSRLMGNVGVTEDKEIITVNMFWGMFGDYKDVMFRTTKNSN